jgi:molybdopterin-guanine dinucleotide biosynthesis protein A
MRPKVCGVVLAGGLSRRMGGGDKALRLLGGRPILAHVIERLAPQVDALLLNANGDPARFAEFDLPVAADSIAGFAGPLAGVLTGMDWAAERAAGCDWIVTAPSDAPFLPRDLVDRLLGSLAEQGADLACAASAGRSHPVVGLWPLRLREALRAAMQQESLRKVDVFTARYKLATVDWSEGSGDPFFNANRPEDLATAEALLRG